MTNVLTSSLLIDIFGNLPIEESASSSVEFTGLVNSLIILLLVAIAVALVTRWLRIPYVVGLVLAGLAISKQALPESVGLNPDVILNLWRC